MAEIQEKGMQYEFKLPFLDTFLTIAVIAHSKEEAIKNVMKGLKQSLEDLESKK